MLPLATILYRQWGGRQRYCSLLIFFSMTLEVNNQATFKKYVAANFIKKKIQSY